MQDFPPWVPQTSDAALADAFGPDTAFRGLAYAAQGRVEGVRAAGDLLTGAVRGSQGRVYQAAVVRRPGGDLGGSCTCPVRFDCKHVAAVLAAARDTARDGTLLRPVSAWQHVLTPLLDRTPGTRGVPLALQISLHDGRVALRAYRQGVRENWIKSGASWSDLRMASEAGGLEPAQLAALKALADTETPTYYRYSTDALLLNDLSPESWRHLRRAVDAGVTLLPANDLRNAALEPVLREDAAEPVLAVEPAGAAIVVRPSFVLGGDSLRADQVAVLGRPGHGLALRRGDEVWLAPLTRPLTQREHPLFTGRGSTTVPEADLPLFATGFLPQLRRRLTVRIADGVELPEARPPRLLCRVGFGPASASVEWGFRYTPGDAVYDLGLEPRAGDPPVRMTTEEAALAASVPEGPWTRRRLDGSPALQNVVLSGRPMLDFVARVLPELRARDDVVVDLDAEPPAYREAADAPRVELAVTDSEAGDWFDLDVAVTVSGEDVPLPRLLAALTAGDDHLILDTGTWFDLDSPEFDQLRALVAEARTLTDGDSDDLRLRPEHAGLWEELVALGVVAEQSASWRAAVGALLDLDELPDVPTPAGLRAELRPYQHTGLAWLSFLRATRLGGVLADEMGLGKTLQTLALVQAAHEAGELDHPVLVVAPTSVIPTWVAEAARFVPELAVFAVPGTSLRRGGVPLADAVGAARIVVTSYTLLRLEADAYAELPWSLVFLDEAQFVKNRSSQVYKAVRRLRARAKFALTGTPLENNLMDLWAILSIVAPGLFPDPKAFTEAYRRPIEGGDAAVLARLHRRIRPLLLRRTKADVASELPPKQEQIVPVELSSAHRRVYERHLTRERQRVLGLVDDLGRNRFTILRSLTLLRQLALSPALVEAGAAADSAKIDALVEWLGELASEGHRALVFSQFTGFLGLVRERLKKEGITTEYLDGRTRDRAARIEAFRSGDATAFLISLKAGGFGLTLTEADYVFILDPWWNPAAETQAIDRTHRIGQDKPVNVYRLVSVDTIEEKVVALQERKRDLFASVLGSDADLAAPLTADEIRGLLAP